MDKNEFTKRVLDSEQMLYRISMSMLKNTADCEDAVQQAILTAYSKLSSLKKDEYFRTWLTRILINECTNQLRRRKHTAPLELLENTAANVGTLDDTAELREAFDSLSPKLRVVLMLKYSEGFSISDIAGALKIPEGTVKSRLSLAKKTLKRTLDDADSDALSTPHNIMRVV